MPLRCIVSTDENILSQEACQAITDASKTSGQAVVLCQSSNQAVRAECQLASQGIAFDVSCSSLMSWVSLRWNLYGDGRSIVTPAMRSIFMTRLLEGDVEPLDRGAGTVDVLCRLAQRALPWLQDLSQDASKLTLGEAMAVNVCLSYANELYMANLVEGVEAMCKLPRLLAENFVRMPTFVLAGFDQFDFATRKFIAELARVADVLITVSAPQVAASAHVLAALSELAQELGSTVEPAQSPRDSKRALEIQELLDELFNPQNVPLEPGQAVRFIEPAGPLAEGLAVVEHIQKLVDDGAQSIVVVAPNTKEAWRSLAPKLHAIGYTVEAELRSSALTSRVVASFMRFAAQIAYLDELARTWPEDISKADVDMSWWPPRAIEDFLLLSVVGVSAKSVYKLDTAWRSNRTLTPEQVLSVFKEDVKAPVVRMPKLVINIVKDIRRGHISAAAQRLARAYTARLAEQQEDEKIPELSCERSLVISQDYGALAALTNTGTSLKACGISLESGDISLTYLLGLAQNALATTSIMCTPRLEADSDRTVSIVDPSMAAGLEHTSADVLIYLDLDSVACAVPAAGGILENLLTNLNIEQPSEPLDKVRLRFINTLRVPKQHLTFVKDAHDAAGEETFPAVMLTEVLACYTYLDEEGNKQSKLISTGHLSETNIEENLSATGNYPEVFALTGPAPAGSISEKARSFVLVPHDGSLLNTTQVGSQDSEEHPQTSLSIMSANKAFCAPLSLSATQIESYLECPYKWFTLKRLKLGSVDADFTNMQKGLFAHRVLEVVHRRLMLEAALKEGLVSEEIASDPSNAKLEDGEFFWFDPKVRLAGSRVDGTNLSQAQNYLLQEFDEHLSHQYQNGADLGNQVLIPHDQQELQQLEDLKTDLLTTLEYETRLFGNFEPRAFEWKFGGKQGMRTTYAGVDVVGTIDRIDVDPYGNAIIIDYKHKSKLFDEYALVASNADMETPFVLPHRVQALMYALIAQRLLEKEGIRVVGALYLGTMGKHEISGAIDSAFASAICPYGTLKPAQFRRIQVAGWSNITSFSQLLLHTENVIALALNHMLEGHIETSPATDKACDWCPVRDCSRRLKPCRL